jgi:predicted DCC family thiol-disulfide oxidoreductase YuxK
VSGRYVLIYDGHCQICCRQRDNIKAFDRRDLIEPVDMHVPDLEDRFPGVLRADCYDAMHFITPSGEIFRAAAAVREVIRVFPWVGWVAHLFHLPGAMWIAGRGYTWVAANRYRWNKAELNACENGACELHFKPPQAKGQ